MTTNDIPVGAPFNIPMDVDVLSPATSIVNQLLDVSPPVAMALVLSCIYAFAVSLTRFNKLAVDVLVVMAAAAVYPQLADPGKVGFAVHNPVAAEVVTGALIGCTAIIFSPILRKVLIKVGALSDPAPVVVTPPPQTPTPPPAS